MFLHIGRKTIHTKQYTVLETGLIKPCKTWNFTSFSDKISDKGNIKQKNCTTNLFCLQITLIICQAGDLKLPGWPNVRLKQTLVTPYELQSRRHDS
jgi:hypothetical protein